MNYNRVHRIEGGFEQSEEWLQRYLANHPQLLPIVDLDGMDTKLRLIGRELAAIDLLFVDERGLLTIVETKLFKNPEARREVIAQLQDYAAKLSKLNVVNLCRLIASLNGNKAIEGLKELENLTKLLNKYVSIDGPGKESTERAEAVLAHYVAQGKIDDSPKLLPSEKRFLEKIDLMLREGSFRLVIVTDRATSELLDLLNYVNSTMRRGHQLIAFELSIEDLEDSKYFVPHLIGAPGLLSAEYYREERGASRIIWNKESFLEDIRKRLDAGKFTDEQHKAILKLLDFAEKTADERHWGTGKDRGSFNPIYSKISVRSLYSVYSDGTLTLNFGWLHDNRIQEKYRDAFKNKLSRIKVITIPPDYQKKYPTIPVDKWSRVVNDFIAIVQDLIKEDI